MLIGLTIVEANISYSVIRKNRLVLVYLIEIVAYKITQCLFAMEIYINFPTPS